MHAPMDFSTGVLHRTSVGFQRYSDGGAAETFSSIDSERGMTGQYNISQSSALQGPPDNRLCEEGEVPQRVPSWPSVAWRSPQNIATYQDTAMGNQNGHSEWSNYHGPVPAAATFTQSPYDEFQGNWHESTAFSYDGTVGHSNATISNDCENNCGHLHEWPYVTTGERDIVGYPVPAAAVTENENAKEPAYTRFNGSQCYSSQDVPDRALADYVSVPLAPDTSPALENGVDSAACVTLCRGTKRRREDDADEVSGPRSVPFRAEQEDNLPATNPLECRMTAITEAIGFRPTDFDLVSAHERRKGRVRCMERVVLELEERLISMGKVPPPVPKAEYYGEVDPLSFRAMLVNSQLAVSRIYDQVRSEEEKFLSLVDEVIELEKRNICNGGLVSVARSCSPISADTTRAHDS